MKPVEELYEKIEKLINEEKGKTNIVIMGDWNAMVGERKEGKTVGAFGLGTRNQRGEKLIKFCEENKFVVVNTLFNCHKRRRYTWKSPGDITRNQIDYILVKAKFSNGIKSAFAYQGADCNSDQNLIMIGRLASLEKSLHRLPLRIGHFEKGSQLGKFNFKLPPCFPTVLAFWFFDFRPPCE